MQKFSSACATWTSILSQEEEWGSWTFSLYFHFSFISWQSSRPGRPPAHSSGRWPIGYRKSYTQLWRPNIAFRESHDDGKEGADLPIIQPKWQSDINGRSTPFVFRMLNVGGGRIHNHIPNLISLFLFISATKLYNKPCWLVVWRCVMRSPFCQLGHG